MRIKTTVVASLLALSATAVLAEDNFYVLGSVGQSKYKGITADDTVFVDDPGANIDNTGAAYKLQLGYQFNPYFALEGGYFNLGKSQLDYTDGTSDTLKADGVNISAVGILPLDNGFSLFGKLGVYESKMKDSYTGDNTVTKASKGGLTYGLGASYDISKALAVRAEYEVYDKVGSNDTMIETKVDMWSIGVAYKF